MSPLYEHKGNVSFGQGVRILMMMMIIIIIMYSFMFYNSRLEHMTVYKAMDIESNMFKRNRLPLREASQHQK